MIDKTLEELWEIKDSIAGNMAMIWTTWLPSCDPASGQD